jgi:hypothetical protein
MEQPRRHSSRLKAKAFHATRTVAYQKHIRGLKIALAYSNFFLTVAPPKTARLDRDESVADNWLAARFIS